MKKTTEKQQKFINFIHSFREENGYSPSVRDIAHGLGLSSTSAVQTMIDRLLSKGLLYKEAGAARTLSVSPGAVKNGVFDTGSGSAFHGHTGEQGIPIMGRIRAGMPVMAEENIEGYIPVHDFLKTSSGGFFLIVEGESMRDKGIMHGDYAFVKPQKEISNGQIGAFRINGEVTLKTFRREKDGRVLLVPANDEFKPIEVGEYDDFEVIGRFVMLLRLVEKGYDRRFS